MILWWVRRQDVNLWQLGALRDKGVFPSRRHSIGDLGVIAQTGERLLCKQDVVGSIPTNSTSFSDSWQSGQLHLAVNQAPHGLRWFKSSTIHQYSPIEMIGIGGRLQVKRAISSAAMEGLALADSCLFSSVVERRPDKARVPSSTLGTDTSSRV